MGRKRIHPKKPPAYQFKVEDNVIYIGGLYSKYTNQKCIVISRSKSKGSEWYKIKTNDGFEFTTTVKTLRKEEENY
jgi:hypothetical protein